MRVTAWDISDAIESLEYSLREFQRHGGASDQNGDRLEKRFSVLARLLKEAAEYSE
jgi:hypothetical protein